MERLERLSTSLERAQIDGILVTNPANRRYLSGFTGSAGILLLSKRDRVLVTDFRYVEQAGEQAPDFRIVKHEKLTATLAELVREMGWRRLGFESSHVSFKQYREFKDALDGVEFVPTEGIVEELRSVKDPNELANIRKAAEITDKAFQELLPKLKVGLTESEISLELEFLLKRLGSDGLAFDPVVASGPNASLPHHRAGDRKVGPGDFLVLDFGARWKGYCADMTRTLLFGPPTPKHQEIYGIVLEAQISGLNAVAPDCTCASVDRVSRDIISSKGYGEHFGHSLGHGVGLEVHEKPHLSCASGETLQKGMIVTIEPGIYIPGWGGVRIEDLVLVGERGEALTVSTKELIVIEN